jgi:glycosyltransferase involved in cell wall biosynthesis
VIASRLKTIRHYFSEEALAYFTPHDTEALAKQMLSVYRDGPRRSRLVQQAKQEVAPIRWELMKERYLKMMQETIGGDAAMARGTPGAPRVRQEVLT